MPKYTGVRPTFLPYIAREAQENTLLLVVPSVAEAEAVAADLPFFLDSSHKVGLFLRWDILPFDDLSPSMVSMGQRLSVLSSLVVGEKMVVVTTPDALTQSLFPREVFYNSKFELEAGSESDLTSFAERLLSLGYLKTSLVEEPGQCAFRGQVVDFFSPSHESPVRVEFFADEVLEIRKFDSATQLSNERLAVTEVFPAREVFFGALGDCPTWRERISERVDQLQLPTSKYRSLVECLENSQFSPGIEHLVGLVSEKTSTLIDYLPDEFRTLIFDEERLSTKLDEFEELLTEQVELAERDLKLHPQLRSAYLEPERVYRSLVDMADITTNQLSALEAVKVPLTDNGALRASLKAAKQTEQPFGPLVSEVSSAISRGVKVGIVCQREARLKELFEGKGLSIGDTFENFDSFLDAPKVDLALIAGQLEEGFTDRLQNFQLITESDIFLGKKLKRARKSATHLSRLLGKVNQLQDGDYVVHEEHGIAIYQGLQEVESDGIKGDFLLLEFAENSRLFIPVDSVGKVQKYVAAEGKQPKLNKLGTKQWDQTKEKVQKKVAEIAGKLISIYANRAVVEREPYGPVNENDVAFADAFGYQETTDQAKAIEDILSDLDSIRPMDRLVCGDVGYGKTEVALRGAYKVASSGKQVALLVPTTILCDQHYKNFLERFSDFDISVAAVSRFNTAKENKEIIQKLKTGEVDIIIGTHRLLSRDVVFKNLGMIVVDEEHRFGVAHKERLKEFRAKVDVLTLTATPIPRTLHMSLTNIRELSVIETPPVDRQVTRTYVTPHAERTVRDAIMRELGRNGQVFYLYNRVQTIAGVCEDLRELVPEARIEFAHGQMTEGELSEVMHRFIQGEIDVLVSTTIIESGLDIPNANTMLITHADKLGLAELYQLRGRVGRSSRRAYCYLLVDDVRNITGDAKKRLQVLESLDDLGQGFRLALRDMEIRGAGNLLGKDQSGQVGLVGFELYSKILKEAIENRQADSGTEDAGKLPDFEPEVQLSMSCYVPSSYISDVQDRLVVYQRLIDLKSEHEIAEMEWEIRDRYGNFPVEVQHLFEQGVLKLYLKEKGVAFLKAVPGKFRLSFHPELVLEPSKVAEKISSAEGRLSLSPNMVLTIKAENKEFESPLEIKSELAQFIDDLI